MAVSPHKATPVGTTLFTKRAFWRSVAERLFVQRQLLLQEAELQDR